MKTEASQQTAPLTSLLLYVSGFLLLWEWLRPIDALADVGNIYVFLSFLLLALTLSFTKMKFLPAAIFKSVYILYFLHYYYYEGSFFGTSWFIQLLGDISKDIGFVIQADWMSLSFVFRSFLFFILLWLMTYLIHYWFMVRKQVLVFFFMTLVYITVLDTFTVYQADAAIVRTVVIGFAVMGALTYYRTLEKEKIDRNLPLSRKWLIPLGLGIVVSVGIGIVGPKLKPVWPDPVPYITSYNEEDSGEGTVSRVGYGTDDSQLGGPFVGDDTLVYTTETDERNYWRVETKDVYTGKGWDVSVMEAAIPFTQSTDVPLSPYVVAGTELEEETATITAERSYPHLIYPLGAKRITTEIERYTFEMDEGREKIYSLEANRTGPLEEYTVSFDVPDFSMTALKATKTGAVMTDPEEGFVERYTQLPERLPQRVRDLAVQITAGKETWYDQAKAIESYFGQNGFTYDQVNVLTPGEGDDYVDQFLFESKKGYCDNYSTSMIVLLRSLGIPSRWVKGYTEGEYKRLSVAGERIYEITNNNAHSWVEVYFPGVGWVPFEPTQGFSNPAQFNYDEQTVGAEQPEAQETTATPEREKPNPLEEEESVTTTDRTWKERWIAFEAYVKRHWFDWVGAMAGLALLSWILYKLRLKWFPYLLLAYFKMKRKDEDFVKAYLVLLRQLKDYGLSRQDGQTLRDYANYVDQFFTTKAMGQLTARYERYVYNGELASGSWDESRELWENLIKKTIA